MIIYKSQITDLRINAPHIKCSVVMPGQIGTSIRANCARLDIVAAALNDRFGGDIGRLGTFH